MRTITLLCAALVAGAIAHSAACETLPLTTTSLEARQAYEQAMAFLERAQPEKARPFFERAHGLDPDFIWALDGLRRTAPTPKEGRAYFQQLMGMIPEARLSEGERIYFEGFAAGANGDQAARVASLEKLVTMFPGDARLLAQLGAAYYATDIERAAKLFRQARHANPDYVPIYNMLGYSLKNLGDLEGAEEAFRKGIELSPDSPNAYDSYAELLLRQGRHVESIAQYDMALAIDALFPSAQVGVAANLCLMGKHEEARERLRRLFPIAPHAGIRSGIHWSLAVTHADEGNLEACLDELENNLRVSQDNEDSGAMALDLRNIAEIQLELGRADEALASHRKAHELVVADPAQNERFRQFSAAGLAYGETRVALARGDLTRAKSLAQRFHEQAEPLGGLFFTQNWNDLQGLIAMAEGRHEQAIDHLQQANAEDAYTMFRIAACYRALGKLDRAAEYYRYVVGYRSPLNMHYSLVRKKAEQALAELEKRS